MKATDVKLKEVIEQFLNEFSREAEVLEIAELSYEHSLEDANERCIEAECGSEEAIKAHEDRQIFERLLKETSDELSSLYYTREKLTEIQRYQELIKTQ